MLSFIEHKKEDSVSICPICSKQDSPIEHSHPIYTALSEESTVALTRKTTETRTRTLNVQKHDFMVCDQCERKWKVIIPAIMWSIIAVVALAIVYILRYPLLSDIGFGSILTALIIGFSFNKLMFSLNAKLKEVAKEEREKTSWKQSSGFMPDYNPRYAGAKKDVSIVAFTEAEYQRLLKKNK
jgi:hypothetical protein